MNIAPRHLESRAVADYTWDVFLPGEDLPQKLTTDYLIQEEETITVAGREWPQPPGGRFVRCR
jgi:hypothetical protein